MNLSPANGPGDQTLIARAKLPAGWTPPAGWTVATPSTLTPDAMSACDLIVTDHLDDLHAARRLAPTAMRLCLFRGSWDENTSASAHYLTRDTLHPIEMSMVVQRLGGAADLSLPSHLLDAAPALPKAVERLVRMLKDPDASPAMVEEATAAARSMEDQAGRLAQNVARFRL